DRAAEGHLIWMFGPQRSRNLAGSAFEQVLHGHLGGRPDEPDPFMAKAVIDLAAALAGSGLVPAMHDIAEGGIAITVAELCIASEVGATLRFTDWVGLFAENPNRFVAAVPAEHAEAIRAMAEELDVPVSELGEFGGDGIVLDNGRPESTSIPLAEATVTYRTAIPRRMA
ncbi:MAG: AIR synthase-related protein, partial [Acidimicrobiia bacterium]